MNDGQLDPGAAVTADERPHHDRAGHTGQAGSIAQDFGPQTFGPAPGSDGDTRDWHDDETAGR